MHIIGPVGRVFLEISAFGLVAAPEQATEALRELGAMALPRWW